MLYIAGLFILLHVKAQEVQLPDTIRGLNAMSVLFQDGYQPKHDDFQAKSWLDKMYVQTGVGLEWLNTKKGAETGMLQSFNLALGKELSVLQGLRLNLSYGRGELMRQESYRYHATGISLDHLFHISSYIDGYRQNRKFQISSVLGAGYRKVSVNEEQENSWEARLGLEMALPIGNQGTLALQPQLLLTDGRIMGNWEKVSAGAGVQLNYKHWLIPQQPVQKENANDSIKGYFLEIGTGIQTAAGLVKDNHSFGSSWSAALGRWLTSSWGVRASATLGYHTYDSYKDQGFAELGLDLLLHPQWRLLDTDFFAGIQYGMSREFQGRGTFAFQGYTAGLDVLFPLQPGVKLFLQPRVSFIQNPAHKLYGNSAETLYQALAGLRFTPVSSSSSTEYAHAEHQPFFVQLGAGAMLYKMLREPHEEYFKRNALGRFSLGYRWSSSQSFRLNADLGNESVSADYMVGLSKMMHMDAPKDYRFRADFYAGPLWDYKTHTVGGQMGLYLAERLNAHTSLFLSPEVAYQGNPEMRLFAGLDYSFQHGRDFLQGLFPEKRNQRAGLESPWFLETGVGSSVVVSVPNREALSNVGSDFSLSVGHWINPAVAARLGVHNSWNTLSSRRHEIMTLGKLDLLFNPLGMGKKRAYDKSVGFNLLAGGIAGYTNLADEGTLSYGYNGGLQLWARLMRQTRFYLEGGYEHLFHEDKPEGEYLPTHKTYITLGVHYDYMTPQHRKAIQKVEEILQRHGVFFQFDFGFITNYIRLNKPVEGAGYKNGWSMALGYQLNPVSGLRAGVDFQNVYDPWITGQKNTHVLKQNVEVSLAYRMDLNNLLQGYDETDRFSFNVYAGPTLNQNAFDGIRFGALAGMQWGYWLNNRMNVYLSSEWHHYNNKVDPTSDQRNAFIYKAGIHYRFNSSRMIKEEFPWFVEAGTGLQFSALAHVATEKTAGPLYTLGVGHWLGKSLGFRITGFASSNRWSRIKNGYYNYVDIYGGRGQIMLDLPSLVPYYNHDNAMMGVNLLGGPFFGATYLESGGDWFYHYTTGFSFGLQYWFRTGSHHRFYIEPEFSKLIFQDNNVNNFSTFAIQAGVAVDIRTGLKHTWKEKEEDKRFFIQGSRGTSYLLTRKTHEDHLQLYENYQLNAGYWLSPVSALRLAVSANSPIDFEPRTVEWSASYQVNLSNWLTGYDSDRRTQFMVYAGPGISHKRQQTNFLIAVAGMELRTRLYRNVYFFVNPEASLGQCTRFRWNAGLGYRFTPKWVF